MNYPPPADNPHCRCRQTPMLAFFCPTGHLLECHYPYPCDRAGCSHLARYDYTDDEVALLESIVRDRIATGRMPEYMLAADGRVLPAREVKL